MAKRKAKKGFSTFGLVLMFISFVGVVLSVVGIFLSWIDTTIIGRIGDSFLLSDLVEANSKFQGTDLFNAKIPTMNAFAIITIVAGALAMIAYLARHFAKFSGLIVFILAALTVVCAIVQLSVTGSVCADGSASIFGASVAECTLGVGGWLSVIGGFLAGGGALIGTLLKK